MATSKTKSKATAVVGYGGPSKAEQMRWQDEDDLRTLMRAKEIEKDKSRLTAARKLAKEQLQTATEATKI